jgi:hypothetical protein
MSVVGGMSSSKIRHGIYSRVVVSTALLFSTETQTGGTCSVIYFLLPIYYLAAHPGRAFYWRDLWWLRDHKDKLKWSLYVTVIAKMYEIYGPWER